MIDESKQILELIKNEDVLNKISGMSTEKINKELQKIAPTIQITDEETEKIKNKIKNLNEDEIADILNVSGGKMTDTQKGKQFFTFAMVGLLSTFITGSVIGITAVDFFNDKEENEHKKQQQKMIEMKTFSK